jgi:hypothetical protein
MKLLISDDVMQETIRFSKRWAVGDPRFEEFRITVPLPTLSLAFFQPERYDQSIACYLAFVDDVGFFFEEVYRAIAGQSGSLPASDDDDSDFTETLERNDAYVRRVLHYFERNMKLLTSVPPAWFDEAVRISDSSTRANFPDIADADLQAKRDLWESWQKPR